MKLPSGSNTMTGGAAISTWSGLSVRGRCRTQAFPCASIAMLDTSPSFHFAGTFGHEGSTSNIGREVCAAASVSNSHVLPRLATMANAIRTAQLEFLRFMAYLLGFKGSNRLPLLLFGKDGFGDHAVDSFADIHHLCHATVSDYRRQ